MQYFWLRQVLTDMDATDEKILLRRLAEGDEHAFDQIYHRYNGIIFGAALVCVKDFDSARDNVQQVFVKIWEKRAIMATIESFRNYIIMISRNLVLDQFRRKSLEARKIAELSESRSHFTGHLPSRLTEDHEFTRILQSAIDLLPPQQRKTYLLIHEELLSYQEAAERLRLSKLTVKRHLELARRSVRSFLTRYVDD